MSLFVFMYVFSLIYFSELNLNKGRGLAQSFLLEEAVYKELIANAA